MEIVVILAGERLGANLNPIKLPRELHRFRFRNRPVDASFQRHAPNFIRNTKSPSNRLKARGYLRKLRQETASRNLDATQLFSPPQKSARSPSIAESPATRCRTRCADAHRPRSFARSNRC